MDSVKLKLNESNEIKFKIHVQGTTTEPGSQDPEFRFVLSEQDKQDSTVGYVFPVKKEQNGTVSVVVPALEGTLSEGKTYIGKMEVLMGTRYFNPSTLQISFEKEFKITAEAVVSKTEVLRKEPSAEAIFVRETGIPTIIPTKPNEKPTPNSTITSPAVAAPIQKKSYNLKITNEDFAKCHGDEKKLKRLIVEGLAKQLSPRDKEFIPLVERTFAKLQLKLNEVKSKTQNISSNGKIDVEDLLD